MPSCPLVFHQQRVTSACRCCIYAGIIISTNAEEACKGVDIAVMVGGFPRKAGMERKDVMGKNVSIYASQAAALEKHANKGLKVGRVDRSAHLPDAVLWCVSWCGPVLLDQRLEMGRCS
jgi:hypothetical protein